MTSGTLSPRMRLASTRITAHTTYPFKIARPHGSVEGTEVRRIIVRLDHEGTVGFGEAAPTVYYGQSLESVESTLERIQSDTELLGHDPFQVVPIVERLVAAFKTNPPGSLSTSVFPGGRV